MKTKFDAWWTSLGVMHLGEHESGESFCGLVETLKKDKYAPWFDSDDHETTVELLERHTDSRAFPAHQRYCKRCARKAIKAIEDSEKK